MHIDRPSAQRHPWTRSPYSIYDVSRHTAKRHNSKPKCVKPETQSSNKAKKLITFTTGRREPR